MVCSSCTLSLWFDMGYSWWFLVYSWWRYRWSSWWPQLGAYRLEITYRIWFDLDLGWSDLILFDLVKFGWVVFILICYGCVKVIVDIRWWWWFKRKCERVMLTNTFRVLVNNLFYKNFDTTFMGNKKTVKILIFFPIKYLFKINY